MSAPELGYFLVADVLGFSAIVTNTTPEAIEPRIREWVSLVEAAKERHGIERCHLFSDTVFAAAPSSEDGLRSLVSFAQELLTTGLEHSFMVRGGISHGTYAWGSLTYGRAVIEAHKLEARQNWIGVACQGAVPHVAGLWSLEKLIAYVPPMKTGLVGIQPVVAWEVPATERLFELFVKTNSIRDGEMVSWEVAEKLDRTILFRAYLQIVREQSRDPSKFWGSLPSHFIDFTMERLRNTPA